MTFPTPPNLPPLTTMKLPDGREVVLLDVVLSREVPTARYIVKGRDAWYSCRSPVVYTVDWIGKVSTPAPR